jgi:hypothetical protein
MHEITVRDARRLALARAGLLKPGWTDLPRSARGAGTRARKAALAVVHRFGYLQLDTVSVAGARSHTIVLLSRLEGLDPSLGERLLVPGEPLFEYWGHEASWIPIELYPAFEFRRRELEHHPWWGDVAGEHPRVADRVRKRIRDEGPLRSVDLEGEGGRGWWDLKVAKRVALQLWSSGELAIRERRAFQRTYDLAERVIPQAVRNEPLPEDEGIARLLLRALTGHGWATTGTLAATWRLRNRGDQLRRILRTLEEDGWIASCALVSADGSRTTGWIRPRDLELAARLRGTRPRRDRGVLLSPFDPLLWDRERVQALFGFHQVLEIFKPADRRLYGYYCLPVLAGERLVARVDLKAERAAGTLRVLTCRYEGTGGPEPPDAATAEAVQTALARYAGALGQGLRTG